MFYAIHLNHKEHRERGVKPCALNGHPRASLRMSLSCSLSTRLRTFAVAVERRWPRFHIHHQLPEVYVLFGFFAVKFPLVRILKIN